MPSTEFAGVRIAYDDLGQGEPALLLTPGWCANRTAWRMLAPLSAACRRVLSMDWRNHGESGKFSGDFGERELVEDALAVIKASGAREIVPVALAHSGWVAIELRNQLGPRIPKLVLVDWLVLDPPPPFLEALRGMQSPENWKKTVDDTFNMWLQGIESPDLDNFVREEMGSYGFEMWSRGAREISAAYAKHGNPLDALWGMMRPPEVLHLYAQPDGPEFFAAQQNYAKLNPWFHVQKLSAKSHFPMFEVPEAMAEAIEQFVKQ
jgi:pimeloyl-ACP methyl ester carboxylesterase